MKELTGFILILAALWFIWFFTKGPEASQDEKPIVTLPLKNLGN